MHEPSERGVPRPTIYDVAQRAGVSHQTVSRVLNNHPHIRESTRARVLRVIEEVNYTPNATARALATRRTRRIGVVIDGVVQDAVNATLRAFEWSARRAGYSVTTVCIGGHDATPSEPEPAHVVTHGVDALCVLAPRLSSLPALRRLSSGLPTIVVNAPADSVWHTISIDHRRGAALAVQHLIERGHRAIAHLAGPVDSFDARERADGWRETLSAAGLPEGPLVEGDGTAAFGFHVGRSTGWGNATAIFAVNDQVALGVVHGLHTRGVRVPEDVSVVGFDDLSDARHFLPPLTTIRQDVALLGAVALAQIVSAIERDVQPHHSLIPPEFVLRESTGIRR